jgi:FdhD protein
LTVDSDESVEYLPAIRLTDTGREERSEPVAREAPVTIYINGEELVTLLCSPIQLDFLAAGYLASEGLLRSPEDLKKLVVDEKKGSVWVETANQTSMKDLAFKRMVPSGCGRGAVFYNPIDAASRQKVTSTMAVGAAEVSGLVRQFQERSVLYRLTGGFHAAALCDASTVLVFSQDIARHSAVDRVFGECFLKNISVEEKLMVTSGRISSEMLLKAARRGIPIVASKSAPTNLAIRLAEELGITVVGYARGKRMNVYSNGWRIK